MSIEEKEIAREQEYVDLLYARLDDLRARAAGRRATAARTDGSTPQAAVERDAYGSLHAARIAGLDAGANGLCFGRLDLTGGTTRYVGRVGLQDPSGPDAEPLLLDWRAPAARPFYVATAVDPHGVARRRRLHTYGRQVTGVADEILDPGALEAGFAGELVGEAALLEALEAARSGRMGDVVATIQAEQDEVIRADRHGVLVVAGGPGTGKTAVALHRAAYLLYAHRDTLAKRAILVVGPTRTFCEYISDVLPGLGETDVLLATVDALLPGVRATRSEPREVAELKGRAGMAEVVAAALRARQAAPEDGVPLEHEGYELRLEPALCRRLRDGARASGLQHNAARAPLRKKAVEALTRQFADIIGADPLGGPNLLDASDMADIRREIDASPAVDAAVDELWPLLTPQDLLADLYADPDLLAGAAPALSAEERMSLYRPHPAYDPLGPDGWTPADVPLLDEAAELLGDLPDSAAAARAREDEAERLEFAEGVLEIAHGSRSTDIEDIHPEAAEVLSVWDLMDAERLAERHVARDDRTPAERAAADRTWAFGHVIVDEAQELSAMAWRMLMRRVPTRSMTVVGDLVQASSPGAAGSWARVLEPYVSADRWRVVELHVNYRAPAEVMAVAAPVLAEIDPDAKAPRSVREAGVLPWARLVPAGELEEAVAAAVEAELAAVGDGNVAVLVPDGSELAPAGRPDLRARSVVLPVSQAKGLEFDSVVVVEPAGIVSGSPRGLSDLYVALTRATQRLGVLHTAPLPACLRGHGWAGG